MTLYEVLEENDGMQEERMDSQAGAARRSRRAGAARETREPAAKVGNWLENRSILTKFCLRKTKFWLCFFWPKIEQPNG